MNIDLSRFDSVFNAMQENAILQTQLLSSISDKSEDTMELNLLGFASLELIMNGVKQSIDKATSVLGDIFNQDAKILDFEKEQAADIAREKEKITASQQ